MSDTPRTDKAMVEWAEFKCGGPNGIEPDPPNGWEFARLLERELNEANETIKDWLDAADAAMQPNEHEQHCTCVGVLQARVRSLERELAEERARLRSVDGPSAA